MDYFGSNHVVEQLSFLCFLQFWYLISTQFWGYFWGPNGLFIELRKGSKTVLGSSWTNLIFYISFNSDIWFLINFGFIFYFLGPINNRPPGIIGQLRLCLGPYCAIFGVGVGFENCFGVYSCSWSTFIFYVFFIFNFWFWLNFGSLFTFGALMGYFWGRSRVRELFLGLLI